MAAHSRLIVSAALAGSKHVEFLLGEGLIKPTRSDLLQRIYDMRNLEDDRVRSLRETIQGRKEAGAADDEIEAILNDEPDVSVDDVDASQAEDERMVVTKGTGKLVSSAFGLPQVDVEIDRALAQVQRSLAKAEAKKKEQQEESPSRPDVKGTEPKR